MGLFVHAYLNPCDIQPDQWEAVYQESLVLLRAFPLPLMRLKAESIGSQKRYVHTPQIACDVNTPDERWEIIGDLLSRQRAEQFELYRHFERQFGSRRIAEEDPCDVFWAEGDGLTYVNGNGVDLFGGKTQGYPYHLAVLAVGMLIESRFPNQCYVFGDIDRIQVEQMRTWCNRVLETPVSMPICLDGERLYQRLTTVFDNPLQAVQRFQTLFQGTNEEGLELLLRKADRNIVLDDLVEDLAHYASLSQLGAIHIVAQLLGVTQDLRCVIDLVRQAMSARKEVSADFNVHALLNVLCSHFITFNAEAREPLNIFIRSQERLATIEDTFTQVFLTLSGAPSAIDFYCEASELLEVFCAYEPDQRERFQAAIVAGEQQCRATLEKTHNLIRDIEQKMAKAEQQAQEKAAQDATGQTGAVAVSDRPKVSDEEAYILQQAALQTKRFPDAETVAAHMHPQLRTLLDKRAATYSAKTRSELLQELYWGSHENGFALKESAWQRIDAEEDLTMLQYLMMLALVKEQAMSFWNWRIHILEHPQTWPYLTGAQIQEAPPEPISMPAKTSNQ